MKILVLTSVLPFQRRNGGEICSARLIAKLCEMSGRVLVIGRGDSIDVPALPQLEARSVAPRTPEFANMSAIRKLFSLTGAIFSGEAWTTYRMSGGMEQALRQAVGDEKFDYVFVDHLQIHAWYKALGISMPVVLLTHNIEHQLYGDMLQRSGGMVTRWALKREQRLLRKLDEAVLRDIGVIACLTASDQAYYLGLAQKLDLTTTVEVLPGYFADEPKDLSSRNLESRAGGPWRIGILGTWTWESNRIGIEWFVRDVLPYLDDNCEVVIGGQGLQASQLPGRVRYLGFVESPERFYRSVDVIAIPSVAGGGIQEKTIEALGYGIPVVATEIALRGLLPCPSHVRMADTPSEFALACCRRDEYDQARTQSEILAWNDERRVKYENAINRLFAAASRRNVSRKMPVSDFGRSP